MATSQLQVLTATHKLCYSDTRTTFVTEEDDDDTDSVISADTKDVEDSPESASEPNNLSIAEELALVGCRKSLFPAIDDISDISESTEWNCDSDTYSGFLDETLTETLKENSEFVESTDMNANLLDFTEYDAMYPDGLLDFKNRNLIKYHLMPETEILQTAGTIPVVVNGYLVSSDEDCVRIDSDEKSTDHLKVPEDETGYSSMQCTSKDQSSVMMHISDNSDAAHPQQQSRIAVSTPLVQNGKFQALQRSEPVNGITKPSVCPVTYFHESPPTMDVEITPRPAAVVMERLWQNRQRAAERREEGSSFGMTTHCNGLVKRDAEAPFSSFDQALEATLQELAREHREHLEIHALLTDGEFVGELRSRGAEAHESYKAWCGRQVQLHTSSSVFPSEIAQQGARHVVMEAVYKHIDETTNSNKHPSTTKYKFLSCRDQLISENSELKADIQELKDQKDTLESKLLALREKKFQLIKDWKRAHRDIRASKRRMRSLEDQIVSVRELTAQNIRVTGEDFSQEGIKKSGCSIM